MADEQTQDEPRLKRAWGVTAAWIAGITTVLGFVGTLSGAFGNITEHFHRHKESDAQVKLADAKMGEGEYQQAFDTYTAALKADPGYKPAVAGQLTAAERWTENFSATTDDNGKIATPVAMLDPLATVFETAVGREQGVMKADAQAHLGWVEWLRHHIFGEDTTDAAIRDMQAAIAVDPSNVYANAMLGNILLQTHRSLAEAVHAFNTAVASKRDLPYARRLQLAGLIRDEEPNARAEMVRAVNAMRKAGEPLDADTRLDARGFCCTPDETTHEQWVESLSAVPPEEAVQTFVWLNETNHYVSAHVLDLHRLFVEAILTEISGDKASALQKFRDLNKKIDGINSSLDQSVPEEIERLTGSRRS